VAGHDCGSFVGVYARHAKKNKLDPVTEGLGVRA